MELTADKDKITIVWDDVEWTKSTNKMDGLDVMLLMSHSYRAGREGEELQMTVIDEIKEQL